MPRYFLEVSYKGGNYSGFQSQDNAVSIQAEVEKALDILFGKLLQREGGGSIKLTGSSRTDAGVHALQNFFHFDAPFSVTQKHLYGLNSLLPPDIAVAGTRPVRPDAHCRFDAVAREYKYYIYGKKSPFLADRAYYYPYKPDIEKLNQVAALLIGTMDFTAFSKRNTQVKTFVCSIYQSAWAMENGCLVYTVSGNRFLRGMVRGLVGTMLKVSKHPDAAESIKSILAARDCTNADFSVPAHGLFLIRVDYPEGYFDLQAIQSHD